MSSALNSSGSAVSWELLTSTLSTNADFGQVPAQLQADPAALRPEADEAGLNNELREQRLRELVSLVISFNPIRVNSVVVLGAAVTTAHDQQIHYPWRKPHET